MPLDSEYEGLVGMFDRFDDAVVRACDDAVFGGGLGDGLMVRRSYGGLERGCHRSEEGALLEGDAVIEIEFRRDVRAGFGQEIGNVLDDAAAFDDVQELHAETNRKDGCAEGPGGLQPAHVAFPALHGHGLGGRMGRLPEDGGGHVAAIAGEEESVEAPERVFRGRLACQRQYEGKPAGRLDGFCVTREENVRTEARDRKSVGPKLAGDPDERFHRQWSHACRHGDGL